MAQLTIIMIQIKHAEKTKFLWPCPGSKMRSRSKWKACCTSTMIVQLIGTKYVHICEAVWAESRTQSTTSLIWSMQKNKVFRDVVLDLKYKVMVKMKGMLHIYNDCTIDWHQVSENMWSGLGWVTHTKYHPSYIKYAGKKSFLWPCPGSEIKSRSKWKVCCTSTIDWHQVCANMWSGLAGVAHAKYHPSYIKYAEKLSFLWPFPESEMRSKLKVCCTSTMIVQLIGIKCVQICEAVWVESRTQSTTPIRDGRTDGRTDGLTHGHEWFILHV